MLFRLTNAPTLFQEQINNVLQEYIDYFIIVYLNNILIYLEELEDYKKQVRTVLTTLRDEALYLSL
jgi:hypothetical protein